MKININDFENDIKNEFSKIRKNLEVHIDSDESINMKKEFLSNHVPKEVIFSSELLLDTVINALMDEAISKFEGSSAKLQNKFYEYDFRGKIKKWAGEIENKLSLEPEYIKYSKNPQLIQSLIASGITFIVGSAITGFAFIPEKVISSIVGGIVSLVLSAVAFKLVHKNTEPKAVAKMVEDIEKYLETTKSQVTDWLNNVILAFSSEFKMFCDNNGWTIE